MIKSLMTFKDWKKLNESDSNTDMINGVIKLISMVKETSNRMEIAEYMLNDFKKENININRLDFLKRCKL